MGKKTCCGWTPVHTILKGILSLSGGTGGWGVMKIRRLYLSRQKAYLQYTISVSQPIPTQKGLSAFVRYTHRDLTHDAQEDLYTTNFHSCTLGLSMDEWLGLKGFHMSSGFTTWWEKRTKLYEAKSRSVFIDLHQKLFKRARPIQSLCSSWQPIIFPIPTASSLLKRRLEHSHV